MIIPPTWGTVLHSQRVTIISSPLYNMYLYSQKFDIRSRGLVTVDSSANPTPLPVIPVPNPYQRDINPYLSGHGYTFSQKLMVVK